MADRISLQTILEKLLNSRNVYYQPPKTLKMEYDAIRYSKSKIKPIHANDAMYLRKNCYELIVISRRPDNPVIEKLLDLPYCSYDRQYVSDNLYHDVLTIYW